MAAGATREEVVETVLQTTFYANVGCDMLAFLLANAQDEAQGQLERLESEIWPESE